MTKEEFIKHLLKAKVVLEKLAKKQDVYDEIEMIDRLIDLFIRSKTTSLSNTQLKAVFFAAYFEVYDSLKMI